MEILLTKFSIFYLLLLLLVPTFIAFSTATSIPSFQRKRDYVNNYYYAIILIGDYATPYDIEVLLDVHYEGQIGALEDHYLFSSPKELSHHKLTSRSPEAEDESNDPVLSRYETLKKKRHSSLSGLEKKTTKTIDSILSVEKQKLRKRHKRIPPPRKEKDSNPLGITDPGFQFQWHLKNAQEKNDINVTGVWKEGITGKGVVAAIVDDGLDMSSDDLADNFFAEGSYDFNDHNPLPRPRLSDDTHGTRCAGEIAAVKNDVCGVGVAPDAKIAGIRILSGQITDADEATALNYEFQKNHIYSCSWGPPDDGRSAEAPQGLILKAIIKGIQEGRGGKGSIFVFASGNGGALDDNCNYDGYTNSLYTVTVGAVDRTNSHPYYAEKCAALLVSTYSSGSGSYIYTTDVGKRNCTNLHGGTSAAAPIATGVFSLVLQIRPDLTWRDIQYLTLLSAIPFNLDEPEWERTKAGRLFNYRWGYGKLDAYTIIQNAKTYKNLGPQVHLEMPIVTVNEPIPDDDHGILSKVVVTKELLNKAALGRLEHVTVTININHTRRGDIEVDLISPNKINSRLGETRRNDEHNAGLSNWTFMTLKHWDEPPLGEWIIQVRDRLNPEFKGVFIDWMIKFWGEQVNTTSTSSTSSVIASPTSVPTVLPTESSTTSSLTTSSSTTQYATSISSTLSKVITTPTETNFNSTLNSENTDSSGWILTGVLISVAFILMGMLCFIRKGHWITVKRRFDKFFSRGAYESVLQQGDMSNGTEELISRNKQSEGFDAFGDSSDEDDNESTRVVFESTYVDEEDEKGNDDTNNDKMIEHQEDDRNADGSSGEVSQQV